MISCRHEDELSSIIAYSLASQEYHDKLQVSCHELWSIIFTVVFLYERTCGLTPDRQTWKVFGFQFFQISKPKTETKNYQTLVLPHGLIFNDFSLIWVILIDWFPWRRLEKQSHIHFYHHFFRYSSSPALVAQWIARQTSNLKVLGSSPN